MKKLFKKFNAMSVKEKIFYIALIIGVFFVLKLFVFPSLKGTFRKVRYEVIGAQETDQTGQNVISDARKSVLNDLVTQLYDDIYAYLGTAENTLSMINALPDNEFIYIAEKYTSKYQKNLYYDVDWEMMPETEEDDIFLSTYDALKLPLPN